MPEQKIKKCPKCGNDQLQNLYEGAYCCLAKGCDWDNVEIPKGVPALKNMPSGQEQETVAQNIYDHIQTIRHTWADQSVHDEEGNLLGTVPGNVDLATPVKWYERDDEGRFHLDNMIFPAPVNEENRFYCDGHGRIWFWARSGELDLTNDLVMDYEDCEGWGGMGYNEQMEKEFQRSGELPLGILSRPGTQRSYYDRNRPRGNVTNQLGLQLTEMEQHAADSLRYALMAEPPIRTSESEGTVIHRMSTLPGSGEGIGTFQEDESGRAWFIGDNAEE